jgi:hypothetical protein
MVGLLFSEKQILILQNSFVAPRIHPILMGTKFVLEDSCLAWEKVNVQYVTTWFFAMKSLWKWLQRQMGTLHVLWKKGNCFSTCLRCKEKIISETDAVPSNVGRFPGFIHVRCQKHTRPNNYDFLAKVIDMTGNDHASPQSSQNTTTSSDYCY